MKYVYCMNKFLIEFSRRYKIKFEKIRMFDVSEISKLITNKKWLEQEYKKRKGKLFLCSVYNKKFITIYGNDAKKYLKATDEKIDLKNIKGISVCSGKIKGRVKIIHRKSEFKNFKKGDVLVTGMTRPEFIVLINKAAAIITDDGGITSHAGIISRELNIPCVIGTRNATKVLKNNDLVEVDANQGIIRILNK